MVLKTVAVAMGAVALMAVAVSEGGSRRQVAGHRFNVPADHIFDASIAWLPVSHDGSFTFLFEPNSNPDQIPEHRVLVQDLAAHCPGDASQLLRLTCGSEKTAIDDGPPFMREAGSIPALFDLYAVRRTGSESQTAGKRQVAYCQTFEPNPVQPNTRNICTTFWAYDGMSLQFSFDESEAARLPTMKKRAEQMLKSWEVR